MIQAMLNVLGYCDEEGVLIQADGGFGPKTNFAVKAFQTAHGLDDDGLVGDITWDKLKEDVMNLAAGKPVSSPGNLADEPGYDTTNDSVSVNWVASMAIALPIGFAGGSVLKAKPVSAAPPDFLNKLNHIFSKQSHNLAPFLNLFDGDELSAFEAIRKAAQEYVLANNVTGVVNKAAEFTVIVNDFAITCRGYVENGFFKIGTFFIK